MASVTKTTALDIITLAFNAVGVLGVGQTLRGADTEKGLRVLNMMMGQWQRKRWLVWHLTDNALNMTGQLSYTVAIGGDFNVQRPDRLEAAFIRMNPGGGGTTGTGSDFNNDFNDDFGPANSNSAPGNLSIDYPLRVLESREDYNRIALKSLGSFPQYVFYDSAWPMGFVYPWPVPSPQYQLHLTLKEVLTTFPTATAEVEMPPEYMEALWSNLAVRLMPLYAAQPDPVVLGIAKASLNTIRQANAQVPVLVIPRALAPGGGYNIYSDQAGPTT